MAKKLSEKTVLVTGASRGIGRGLAIGLGELGAKVIITGRNQETLENAAAAVRSAGGTCDFHVVDHSDENAVAALFKQLAREPHLDAVVNNAYSAVNYLVNTNDKPSWKKADIGETWDIVNNVGLRNNFITGAWALRQFERQGYGVLVNVSSFGGIFSLFDAAYGVGKSAVDRLSVEFAREAPKGSTVFTWYPGAVSTDEILRGAEAANIPTWNFETPLFNGRALAHALADEASVKSMQGKIVISAEVAQRYGVTDENGKRPISVRSFKYGLLDNVAWLRDSWLAGLIPEFGLPYFMIVGSVGLLKFW